ncbi:MAG TPA: flagellar basal body P-ring formation chaperone FlgA [Longimicrobiaceae bacterium]|nr:flagellar basal body P-ring formation chaperone FlgA [Longimicrobiaceae bacterium]
MPRLALLRPAALVVLAVSLLAARAAAQAAKAPVAARDLDRGIVLTAKDVTFPAGTTPDSAAAPIGWTTRRVIAAGEPLMAPSVAPPDVIRQGSAVQLVWRTGGLELRLIGRAMNSAAAGERVLVRVDMHRRFSGVAVGPGIVRMDSPHRSTS